MEGCSKYGTPVVKLFGIPKSPAFVSMFGINSNHPVVEPLKAEGFGRRLAGGHAMNMVRRPSDFDPTRGRKGVHSLDHLNTHELCGRLTVSTPTPQEIDDLMDRARVDLPGIASNAVVRRVAYNNPDTFWAIRRKSGDGPARPRGFAAFLMLGDEGVDALIRGRLDRKNPPAEFLVGQHQRPAAIYVWLVHAKGMLAPALGLVMEKLRAPLYRDVDLIARAVTQEGSQFNDSLGFQRGLWWDGQFYPAIHHYRREASLFTDADPILLNLRAPYDDYCGGQHSDRVTTKLVHNFEELAQAVAIRSAVYIGEQLCPYREEFDGNDYSCTHFLAYQGQEPIGCLRVRYFAEFVKFERLAVRKEFRRRGAGRKLVTAATEFCRTKGYGQLYAHARRDVVDFWSGLGFAAIPDGATFRFSDFEYIEIGKEVTPLAEALSLASDPYILIRPEGQWDRPGILEQSAGRFASAAELVA
jgi:predicted GNAT family N-acyltransferase